jgi:hypothetical protein
MSRTLEHRRVATGVEFFVRGAPGPEPPDRWALVDALRLPNGKPARVGVLLRALEDGQAEVRDQAVFLSHSAVAALEDAERRSVGLPESPGLVLELRSTGAFSDPDFRIDHRLLHGTGHPVVGAKRDGCFVAIGNDDCVLPEPIFSLCEKIDAFNRSARDIETRYLAWGELAEHLPGSVRVGDDLRDLRISVATAFTLNPFQNERREPDFDPVLGRWVEQREGTGEPKRGFIEVIPPARQRDFARRFRELSGVRHRYAVGGGVFVVLSPKAERLLSTVREIQGADAGTRRRFLTRPSTFLRDVLEGQREKERENPDELEVASSAELEEAIDEVFFDEGLSDRVKGVGVWEPKILPWLKPSGESWIPDEVGIRIDDQLVSIPRDQLPAVLEEVRKAREEGRESIDVGGHLVPATEAAESALRDLLEELEKRDTRSAKGPDAAQPGHRIALLIIDNVEQLSFRMEPRRAREGSDRLPSAVKSKLLRHQQEGLSWLQQHWTTGSPGALLADDMGLGKTLQALAFLAWVREQMDARLWPERPFLVVAPTGLLRNWRDEHDRHLEGGGLGDLLEAYGARLGSLRPERAVAGRELSAGLPSLEVAELGRHGWVMTTYETLRDYQHSFARVRWAVTVFDEAQKIKNPAAGLTDAAKAMNQDFTLAMTGTPVENRIEDLWCITDTARPGSLGALKDFSASFRVDDPADLNERLSQLRDQLGKGSVPSAMLRRLKEDHLDGLPSKVIHTHKSTMPPRQADAYREALASSRGGARILEVLQRLRSVSLHPSASDAVSDDGFIGSSARLSMAFEILDEIQSRGDKALLFLDSRSVQDALAEILQRRYRLPHRVLIINGDVSGTVRKRRVDEFEERPGFDAMILSPRAGGVGLTITAANHVIHLARWWNPAVEDQCTDRVYRIGQMKDVHIHHVLAVHPQIGDRSFDLRLASLLDRKRGLNRAVLAPAGATDGDLQELYRETVELSD